MALPGSNVSTDSVPGNPAGALSCTAPDGTDAGAEPAADDAAPETGAGVGDAWHAPRNATETNNDSTTVERFMAAAFLGGP
ncbi:hypothetical protein GCM10022255_084170 [Dactylosporangium darangshiense]|uniref:Uncharacterized protein n=1 Tax=Dactylosporangium darangshiense TaxID=579108 RepID=A0ABP8DM41_9ACTN